MRILLLLVFCGFGRASHVPVTIRNKWEKGIVADFSIPVNKHFNGWTATISFSFELKDLEIWRANVVNCSSRSCIIKNKSWNAILNPGDQLKMGFMALFADQVNHPSATVSLHQNDATGITTPPTDHGPTTVSSKTTLFTTVEPALQHTQISTPAEERATSTERSMSTDRPTTGPIDTTTPRDTTTNDPGAAAARVQVSVKNQWGNGMEGEFSIKVNKALNGWKATITFSTDVQDIEIWEAAKSWCGGNTCEIKNLGWNAQLNPGDTLKMNFVARFSGYDPNPSAHIVLQGNGGDNIVTNKPVGPTTGTNPGNGKEKYNYNEILEKSILFYEAQRSGKLPANKRISWRGDSALQDRGNGGEDLTGGWYDAGDNVKFGFPMAWTTTTLIWGLIEYKDGYQAAGQLDWMYECVKWPLDYFMKAHTKKYEFYGQLGNGHEDHASWVRPESMNQNRPAYKVTSGNPGSELTGETAAALAAGAIAFKTKNPTYSAQLLRHAKELFDFASKYRGKYTSPIPDAQSFYGSTTYEDELVWAAAWLYRATNDDTYLNFAKQAYKSGVAWAFSWDEKKAGYQLLMYSITKDISYKNDVQAFLDSWMPGGGIKYTPKGLAWRDAWGSLRYSANSAFLALLAADQGIKPGTYRQFAMKQIHYMLGDTGRSYVVGFGNNPPVRPHHRAASCPNASCGYSYLNSWNPNPHVLHGALVGGPDQNDNYVDDRNNHQTNEVATDYNGGFTGAVAGLKHLSVKGQLPS